MLVIPLGFWILEFLVFALSCEVENTNSKPPAIVFYHTRKCGGWTIHNYFAKLMEAQPGNACEKANGQVKDKDDWRCEMGYHLQEQNTSPNQQCLALRKFYNSSYRFSQVELPLLQQQIFPSFITTMTVLRHPIERVVSSYRMTRNAHLSESNWTMKAWLLHLPVRNSAHRQLLVNISFPVATHSFPRLRSKANRTQSTKGNHTKPHQQSNPPHISQPSPKTPLRPLPTDGLDENYMTKWFCGKWKETDSSPATEECYQHAIENLNKIDIVYLTQSLTTDLPLSLQKLGLDPIQEEVLPYNIRMHDPVLESQHDLTYSTNISNITSISEFSNHDGTYQIAVKRNRYDLKLYRHALYRNCVTLNKGTLQDCWKMSSTANLVSELFVR